MFRLDQNILPLLFLFLPLTVSGQKLEFEHVSYPKDLVNENVNVICRDSYGFMWFGTYNGLVKFDGYSVKRYLEYPNSGYNEKIDVRCLLESKDSLLLFGTFSSGLFIFDHRTETFTRYVHDDRSPASLSHNYIISIFQDKKGNIWLGTQTGLDKFDKKSGKFQHFQPFPEGGGFVHAIEEDKEGNLLFYGGTRVAVFDPSGSGFRYITVSDNPKLNDVFTFMGDVLIDNEGKLWVTNILEGVSRYDLVTGEITRFNEANSRVKSNIIADLIKDSEGNIWMGSDGTGVYMYDTKTGELVLYQHSPEDPNSLFNNNVHCIYEGEPGVIWVGMYAGGVDIASRNRRKFSHITTSKIPGKGLSVRSVLAMSELPDGRIAIGTDGGGLNIYDPLTGNIEYLTEENGKAGGNVVKSLLLDKDGELWMGTYIRGLYCTDFVTGHTVSYRADKVRKKNSILRDNVWAIEQASDEKIWIGLLSGGANVIDKKKNEVVFYPLDTLKRERKPCNVISLLEDSRKRMWIGTEKSGVLIYEPSKGTFQQFKYSSDSSGIPSNEIRDILEDIKGNIWLGTGGGGLCKISPDFKFVSYKTENALSSNYINAIIEDDNGNIWLGSDRGISRFDPVSEEIMNFDVQDGLQEMGFNIRSSLKTSGGYIYFGGINGFNFFHPDSLVLNEMVPSVTITDFKIFNTSISPVQSFRGKKYLSTSIQAADEIILDYLDDVISIEFAALNYIAPLENRYAYMLEGFDEGWNYVGADKRFATYTNLDPGEYVFRVIGSNNDNFWNTRGASLRIIVLPPWWMTWWFKVLITVLGVVSVLGYIYIRTSSIKKTNRLLEQAVKLQTAELQNMNSDLLEKNQEIMQKNEMLEQSNQEISRKTVRILEQQEEILKQKGRLEELNRTKDKFFSIIAHDLRNPVNALMVLTKMLNREFPDPGPVGLELIKNLEISSERLKSLVLNLLEWAKSQEGNIRVDPIQISLKNLVEENIELHFPQASQKEISISCEIENSYFVLADYNMLSTVIRNLLSNSIKFTPKGGSIQILARPDTEGRMKITIQDNGVGMNEQTLNRLFSKNGRTATTIGTEEESGTGLGLMLVKEFVQLNKGNLEVETREGSGTLVMITIPGGIDMDRRISGSSDSLSKDKSSENEPDERQVYINPAFKGKKILIVDDDEVIRNSLKHFLSDSFETYEAAEVNEALALSEEIFPDLIISDIVMPGESGISFCQTIKKNLSTSHIPVILLTGQGSEKTHLDGLIAGADSYIQKPFDRLIFLSTINNLFNFLEQNKLRFSSNTELLPTGLARTSHDETLLARAVQLIEENISDTQLKGEYLCKELGISKTVLYVKLKNLTGQTVNEFIRTVRLKKSTHLLLQEDMSISQISDEMGFSSASYFTKCFHQHFGMSPSEFVNRQKERVD